MDVVVVGGGAAGFFAALSAKEHNPEFNVTILEKSSQTLSKVKISGGGRCNVTHSCFEISKLVSYYPRGERFLKKAFYQFQPKDTIHWFQSRNVLLKTERDNRVFPESDSSQTIIDCFLSEVRKNNISIQTSSEVKQITFTDDSKKFALLVKKNKRDSKINGNTENSQMDEIISADKVIVTTGGMSKNSFLFKLDMKINQPVASLFSFNIQDKKLIELKGLSFIGVSVKINELKNKVKGDLLITHWGISGPSILELSSLAARSLYEKDYIFKVTINWSDKKPEEWQNYFLGLKDKISKQKIKNHNAGWANRFWVYLLQKTNINEDKIWADVSKKEINRLIQCICQDEYLVEGKTTCKEEFVTCGGVDLSEINHNTMESKKYKGLYFAGEVLDIDGITGGFNFQSAWTTGYIAGRLMN